MSGLCSMYLTMGKRISSMCLLVIVGFLQFQGTNSRLNLLMGSDVGEYYNERIQDCERLSLLYLNECCPLFEYADLRCTSQPISVGQDLNSVCRTVVSLSDPRLETTTSARQVFTRLATIRDAWEAFAQISNTCRARAHEYRNGCCLFISSHLECINT